MALRFARLTSKFPKFMARRTICSLKKPILPMGIDFIFKLIATYAINNMRHINKPLSYNFSTLVSAADVNEGKTEISLKYTPVYYIITNYD